MQRSKPGRYAASSATADLHAHHDDQLLGTSRIQLVATRQHLQQHCLAALSPCLPHCCCHCNAICCLATVKSCFARQAACCTHTCMLGERCRNACLSARNRNTWPRRTVAESSFAQARSDASTGTAHWKHRTWIEVALEFSSFSCLRRSRSRLLRSSICSRVSDPLLLPPKLTRLLLPVLPVNIVMGQVDARHRTCGRPATKCTMLFVDTALIQVTYCTLDQGHRSIGAKL